MKLILCKECQDVVRLRGEEMRFCSCKKTGGRYVDDLNAVYFEKEPGLVMPLGFANSSLVTAVHNQPEHGMGKVFTAFVIPKECLTFEKIDYPNE